MKLFLNAVLLFWLLACQSMLSQSAPVISYTVLNKFTIGQTIAPLVPDNLGGMVNGVQVSTLAGNSSIGAQDGFGASAGFYAPYGMLIDVAGNILVADNYNHKIRKITPEGLVSTFAGTGIPGSANGLALAAGFNYPSFVVTDTGGNLYIADTSNNKIRKITPSGTVSTFAGSGTKGFADGPALVAAFNGISGMVFDKAGNLYANDFLNHRIRKITPLGMVTTLAGNGTVGAADGMGEKATFSALRGLTIDDNENLYALDKDMVRKITPAGLVTTFVVDNTVDLNKRGFLDLVFDKEGNLLVTAVGDHKVKTISPSGIITDFAGDGRPDSDDGPGDIASIYNPAGIVKNSLGDFYVSTLKNTVRKLAVYKGIYRISPQLPGGLSFNAQKGIISGTPNELSPETIYTVEAQNQYGSSVFNIKIAVNDIMPIVSYTTPVEFIKDETITPLYPVLNGGRPESFSIAPDLPQGLFFDQGTGTISGTPLIESVRNVYTVSVSNSAGIAAFEIEIAVKKSAEITNDLLIAEAVTSNGDGINDTWVIKNIEKYTNSVVKVFNRWGTEVFTAKNYQNDWDGHYKNKTQSLPESGSYYYRIDIDGNGGYEKEGWMYITK